ncbi:MAG: hypothetical protein AAF614_11840 [Chloroflexota bacterium]
MQIRHRIGRTTRFVDVPLCTDCAKILAQRSAAEVRWQMLSWVITAVLALLTLAAVLMLTPVAMSFVLRLLTAVFAAAFLAGLAWSILQYIRQRAAAPEKKAVQNAAAIDNFSWRTTTFKFANEAFAERFRLLNESLLMD